jgi:hypothetical protein
MKKITVKKIQVKKPKRKGAIPEFPITWAKKGKDASCA